ncbi:MAG: hypothetical protein SGPRY_008030 [Prymnesium sp.]
MLSHSLALQDLFSKNKRALTGLQAIESKQSKALSHPMARSLQQEAAVYARWALRTPHGLNHKPLFKPKSNQQLRKEAATIVQKHGRRKVAQRKLIARMILREDMAIILQACYRSHVSRAAVHKRLGTESAAAAMVQAAIRGFFTRQNVSQNKYYASFISGDRPTSSAESSPRPTSESEALYELNLHVTTNAGSVTLGYSVLPEKPTSSPEVTMSVSVHTSLGSDIPLLLHFPPTKQ